MTHMTTRSKKLKLDAMVEAPAIKTSPVKENAAALREKNADSQLPQSSEKVYFNSEPNEHDSDYDSVG